MELVEVRREVKIMIPKRQKKKCNNIVQMTDGPKRADKEMKEAMKEENFGIEMERPEIKCIHYEQNNQCIGSRCPFR